MKLSNEPYNKDFRCQLRHDMTDAERLLWKRLCKKQLDGWKFRRQHGLGDFVMDFYCPIIKLCIEVDGGIHDEPDVHQKDVRRTEFLEKQGIRVLRFKNEEIENNIDDVVNRIKEYIKSNQWNIRFQKKER